MGKQTTSRGVSEIYLYWADKEYEFMNTGKRILLTQGIMLGAALLLMIYFGGFNLAGFGLAALLSSFADLLMVGIYSATGNRPALMKFMIPGIILFLSGFLLCSVCAMNFH
jgi:hypothetical protein